MMLRRRYSVNEAVNTHYTFISRDNNLDLRYNMELRKRNIMFSKEYKFERRMTIKSCSGIQGIKGGNDVK